VRSVFLHPARCAGFLVAAFVLVVFPLGAQSSSPPAPPAEAMHEVVDEFGRTVHVPVVPTRIVSLAPSLTETIYALGAQDRLVGVTDFCDYPPDAQKKTKVGGAINPNLEEIASLHPDLVLVTKELNRMDTVRALDTLGIPTYAADAHTRTVDDIIVSTQKLADLLGVSDAGKAIASDLRQRLAALQDTLQATPPVRVLFVVWTDPLISVGKNTFIADAIRKADGINIVQSEQDWPQLDLEEVARLQPEYLVFASSHSESVARDFDALANRPGWRILDAVRNRRFAVISDAVNRPAPRIVFAIEDLARQLHPAAFPANPAPESPAAPVPAKPNNTPAPNPAHTAGSMLTSLQETACAR
jgi:iron complex transport system substrate-binding protein